jgi:hypothetical protein
MKSPHRIARYAILGLALVILVPSAFAAKGGSGKNGSDPNLTLVVLGSTSASAAVTQPQWGQHVTFDVVTDASWANVEVDCAQNGAVVYKQINPYPFGTMNFTLSGYWWTGGAADCSAALFTVGNNGSRTTLATTSFHVAA